jgi:hypothetical protein
LKVGLDVLDFRLFCVYSTASVTGVSEISELPLDFQLFASEHIADDGDLVVISVQRVGIGGGQVRVDKLKVSAEAPLIDFYVFVIEG